MILREFRRRFQRMWGTFVVVSVIVYFAYHLISGQRGFLAWRNLELQLQQRISYRNTLQHEHTQLEHDINLLKADRVSTDYVEERAKSSFAYARPNEVVVIHKKATESPSKRK